MFSDATSSGQPNAPGEGNPVVSIIIVNWNGAEFIDRCLKSVLRNVEMPYEVVAVDNASSDGSCDLIERISFHDKRVRLMKLQVNEGFSIANNVGVSASKGEFVALLNPDTEVERGWLGPLLD